MKQQLVEVEKIEYVTPKKGPLRSTLITKGTIFYNSLISIRSMSTGRIAELVLEDGKIVSQGEKVARITDSQLAFEKSNLLLEIADEKHTILALTRDLFILDRLIKVGGASQFEHDKKVQEKVMHDRALTKLILRINHLNRKIDDSVHLSPLVGVVLSTPVKLNQWVNVGQELMTIGGGGHYIEAYIDVLDIEKIDVNQKVLFSEHENSPIKFKGTVAHIATISTSDHRKNSVQVKIQPIDAPMPFRLNQDIYVEFILFDKASVIHVPRKVVHTDGVINFVYILNGTNVTKRIVQVNKSNHSSYEITSGLLGTEKIVTGKAVGGIFD